MYKNVLESITGVEIYPIISLLLFVIVFSVMLIYVLRGNKQLFDRISTIPLEEDVKSSTPIQ